MAQIIWSKLAISDIEAIHDYIAGDSVFYAQKTIESFFSRVEVLETFPEIGRIVPEYTRKDIRELIEGNYRIFYKISLKYISSSGFITHHEKSGYGVQAPNAISNYRNTLSQLRDYFNISC